MKQPKTVNKTFVSLPQDKQRLFACKGLLRSLRRCIEISFLIAMGF